jgi:hypothetical protein
MAIEDFLPKFISTPPMYQGLLDEPDRIALEKRANLGGLLGAVGALAQGMSPQGYRRSALQNVLSALGAGFQGAGQTFESGISQMGEIQKLQQARRDIARQQQARDAMEAVIRTPEVANNPAMVAYFRANPDKALERFVAIQETQIARGVNPNAAPSAVPSPAPAPVSAAPAIDAMGMRPEALPPFSGKPEVYRVPMPDEAPVVEQKLEKLAPVSVEKAPSRYAQQLKEADAAQAYFSNRGNTERAKAAREEAESLRNLIRQEELAESVRPSLEGVHPMLQGTVEALATNAASMTPAEIQGAISEIRKKDADFRYNSETELRKEFAGLTPVKEFPTVKTAYNQILNALNNPSAASDLTAATKFMKLLDPGSVVRESELGMAMAATGAIERMQNYFQRLQDGQMLNPAQRADFKKAAGLAFQAAEATYNDISNQYIDLAKSNSLNPNNVVLPQRRSVEPKVQSERPTGVGKDWRLSQDAQGNRAWVSPDGTKFVEVK